jgi:hypothetical protein
VLRLDGINQDTTTGLSYNLKNQPEKFMMRDKIYF